MPRPPRTAEMTCPTCHTPVQASFTWCPTCGAALKPQPCVYCGQILAPEDKNCSACGAPRARSRAGSANSV
ncbi:MAG: zinc ribbon domain-containing protein [Chloroflexi bacterium]|nr:zinc ribbon domain-containing protein [Chloroflexota bacterium]